MVTKPCRNTTVFGAVADPIRRAILDALVGGEISAGDLAARFPVSRPAISRHLRVLRGVGLVSETRRAQSRLYTLNPAPLADIDRWLTRHRLAWGARLHDLKRHVQNQEESR